MDRLNTHPDTIRIDVIWHTKPMSSYISPLLPIEAQENEAVAALRRMLEALSNSSGTKISNQSEPSKSNPTKGRGNGIES